MTAPRILAFAGSTRTDSLNRRLVRVAAEEARGAGAEVSEIDLGELELPLFNADLEAEHGLPPGAVRLKRLMAESDGLLISSPEYNSSISPLLKNAIDWASRRAAPEEAPLIAFRGKVAALLAASPGALGGLRGLVHLRSILGNLGMVVLPEQRALARAHQAFDDAGALTDDGERARIAKIAERLVRVAGALRS